MDLPKRKFQFLEALRGWKGARLAASSASSRRIYIRWTTGFPPSAETQLQRKLCLRRSSVTVLQASRTRSGQKITDKRRCDEMFPAFANPRLNAGMPLGPSAMKCPLKPIDPKDYSRVLTEEQIAALRIAFP